MSGATNFPVSGVLLGDQGDSSVPGSDKLYLLVDNNGDGDAADDGERVVFYDQSNAEGLGNGNPTGNILNIAQASDLSVYFGDGDTDAVYRLIDNNNDGDANDAGESTEWFSEANNAAGFTLPTPNGIEEGADGAIYIVNAGVSSRPSDGIYRTEDLNGDGDANDAGEATLWLDLTELVPTSSPYDLSFIGDRGYLIDPSGSAEDAIYTFRDEDGSGAIEADEFSVFATKTQTGAPIDFTAAADGDSMVVWEWLDRDEGVNSVVRLEDLDGSGAIDQPDETVEIWNTDQLPGIFDTLAGFSIAASGDGQIALTSNDSGASGDNVYLLTDRNGDGDYFDTGETNVLASRAFDEDTLARPRSVEFYEGAVQPANITASAGNHFSIFLDTETNTVYGAGENLYGQLGQGGPGFDVNTPVPLEMPDGFNETIVSVSAGMLHGSLLTESGDVYVWGFGNTGRLGLGDQENRFAATKLTGVLDDANVVIVENGNGVSFAITDTGDLYGWGQNTSGQLGLGDEVNRYEPAKIDIDGKTVVSVSSGTSHTLVLTSDGAVYGFGGNRDGEADPDALEGPGDPVNEILTPQLVEGLPDDIVSVTADTSTSFAVTSDGRVFGWGENEFGQLFVGDDNGDGTFTRTDYKVLEPRELTELPDDVIDVKAGGRWAVALTDDGDVFMWGRNDDGPSGGLDGDPDATSDAFFYPVEIAALDDVNIVSIANGPNSILATGEDGTVYAFGLNGDGRLGVDTGGATVFDPVIVDFNTADDVPVLLTATPSLNGRDVAANTAVSLTYTEDVFAAEGTIRIVNRNDPDDVITVDVSDRKAVSIDGDTVTIEPGVTFALDTAYAVQITDGAFVDADGQAAAGIANDDLSTYRFTIGEEAIADGQKLNADGDTLLRGTAGQDTLHGDDAGNMMHGDAGEDMLIGYGGTDSLYGGDNNDLIGGKGGNDAIYGQAGNDDLRGGGGNDTIRGGAGNDDINGGAGNDSVAGQAGEDLIFGVGGDDRINGGDGNDKLNGGAGNDTLNGQNGDDVVNGGAGHDFVLGRDGDDNLSGGGGDDIVRGGAGDDTLSGDGGNDLLIGDGGDDIFIFRNGADAGNDKVNGNFDGEDIIALHNSGFDSFEALQSVMADVGDNVEITLGSNTLTVLGTDLAALDASDFIFA
ncbi:Ig-like domain-containing protein [Acuticoccus sp. MNP-M23]|uniref:RCC1 domain-containing protein n=1 Tax=Acuticoccus sp. MNP-M23 TaxID=3072793 RepID=UPI0028151EE0|nr:Ig-like domain-containing protein [Acuticoccus sp. MNP-M23]WMS40912.1 Ig-like domain-containing protein [Acuticoccus sp. MNP-M23]